MSETTELDAELTASARGMTLLAALLDERAGWLAQIDSFEQQLAEVKAERDGLRKANREFLRQLEELYDFKREMERRRVT